VRVYQFRHTGPKVIYIYIHRAAVITIAAAIGKTKMAKKFGLVSTLKIAKLLPTVIRRR
jgi:hypothetical protein